MNHDHIGLKLSEALNDENATVAVTAVLDRKLYPSDEHRNNAVNQLLAGLDLLESAHFPIVGVIYAEGQSSEIRKLLDSQLVISANMIG